MKLDRIFCVLRGGSWLLSLGCDFRCVFHYGGKPEYHNGGTRGFRIFGRMNK